MPSMKFEFDAAKSAANKAKHKLDFMAAQALWADVDRALIPGNSLDEPRQLLIARYAGKIWAAVFTVRGENIRIISVRRARESEEKIYEQAEIKDDGQES